MSVPAPMIGVDARKLVDFGIGSYIRNLLEAVSLRPEAERYRFRVYARKADRDAMPPLPPNFEVVEEDSPGYSLAELTRFAFRLFRDRLDLFHATHYVLPPLRCRAVVTIHDIIHLLYPEFLPNRAALIYARVMIRRALARADRIITVSYNSKRDLVDYFGIAPSRVEVIYNGVSPRFRPDVPEEDRRRVAEKYGLPRPYLLFLGGEKPHKNAQNVVRAFAEARRRRPDLPHALVLAGPMPGKTAHIDALIAALDVGRSIVRPRRIADEDLPALFAGADVLLYPTLYEGFGLPVVEAMACGTPVLTSSTSALQEIAGGYAYLVDPLDVDAIARGIVLLATDSRVRSDFVLLGRKRARDFSWDKAAERTLEVYAEALARTGKR
ncbi:MAG: glycosyltransferase family 4 protein [Acidobacteriota bacterium]|nr:glycosyltransferase family 4 protein [Acidobacteriota bacterium]MDQ5873337.1 glycosyltransferase family 4 protein [Acidobacteriota bacterium]